MDKGYYTMKMKTSCRQKVSQSTIKMDKGYYYETRNKRIHNSPVAIHNKNG